MTDQNSVEIIVKFNAEQFEQGVRRIKEGLDSLPRHLRRIVSEFAQAEKGLNVLNRAGAQRNVEAERHANRRELQEQRHAQKIAEIAQQSNARLTQIEAQKASQLSTIEARREAQVRRHSERLTEFQVNAAERAKAKLSAIGSSIGQAFLAAGTFLAGKTLFDRVADIDRISTSLAVLEGSAEKATARMKQLRSLADTSVGLTRSTALEGFQQLKAIGGIEDQTINRTLQGVGKLGSVFKIDSQRDFLRNQVQIFQQDFERSDIKEALGRVPIFEKILEQAFGTKDGKALKTLKESGKLTLDTYLSGIASAIENNPQLANVQESIGARFEKLKDKALDAIVPLGSSLFTVLGPGLEQAVNLITRVSDAFAALPAEIQTAISLLAGLLGIIAAFGTGVGEVVAVVGLLYAAWSTNFGGIQDVTRQAFDFVMPFIREQVTMIVTWWNENLPLIKQTVATVLTQIRAFWANHGEQITAILKGLWQIVTTIISTGTRQILNLLKLTMQVINGDWAGAWQTLRKVVETWFSQVTGILKGAGTILFNLMKFIFTRAFAVTDFVVKKALEIGRDIVDGLVSGIKGGAGRLYEVVKDAVLSIPTTARRLLESRSPSVVMMRIGYDVMSGLAVGIERLRDQPAKAMENVLDLTLRGIRLKASEIKDVLKGIADDTRQALIQVAQFNNPQIFAAKNQNEDARARAALAEGVFRLSRDAQGLAGAPFIDRLPTDEAGLQKLKAQYEAAIALNEKLKTSLGDTSALALSVASSFKSMEEAGIPVPEVIRQMNDEFQQSVETQTKALASYDRIKQGLQGVIDSTDKLTQSQKLQREIASLPVDFPEWKRAELINLAARANAAEQAQAQLAQAQRISQTITNTFEEAFRDGFQRGPKAFFARILETGKETFQRLAANALATLTTGILGGFVQRLSGLFRGGNTAGGGFSFGNLFGGLLGGNSSGGLNLGGLFGPGGTATFAGGGGGILGSIGGLLGGLGGGLSGGLPASLGTSSILSAIPLQSFPTLNGATVSGVARGGLGNIFSTQGLKNLFGGASGLKSILGGSLALPLLGGALGASLGGQSRVGNILGGLGGALLGGVGLATIGGGAGIAGILGGLGVGGTNAAILGSSAAGLLTNPFTAIIGAGLLVGSYFLGKAKARKADEKLVDTYWVEYMETLKQLTKDVDANRIAGDSAMQQALASRAQAVDLISQIKTKSVRESRLRNQIPDVDRLFLEPLKDAIERQKARGANVTRITPEFATGGHVGRLLKASEGLRVTSGRGWPHDDVAVRVSRDEAILNPIQIARLGTMMGTSGDAVLKAAGVPGYAGGRMPELSQAVSAGQPIILNLEIESRAVLSDEDITGIVVRGASTDKGQRVIVSQVRNARRNKEL